MKSTIGKWMTGLIMAVFCGYSVFAGVTPWELNGITWTNYYRADTDGLPTEADPVWISEYATGTHYLTNNSVRIETEPGQQRSFRTVSGWDLTQDMIVEATFRVISQTEQANNGAGSIVYGNGSFYGTVLIGTDLITGAAKGVHDFTDWTTVRLVFEGMDDIATATVKVYIDNNPVAVATNSKWTESGAINFLRFGDPNGNATTTDGVMEWQSVRWAAIPEPGTVTLFLFSSGMLYAVRKLKSK
ncbi:MAG: hypothetical protein WC959_03000 [Kiritimatiellales bacterium]